MRLLSSLLTSHSLLPPQPSSLLISSSRFTLGPLPTSTPPQTSSLLPPHLSSHLLLTVRALCVRLNSLKFCKEELSKLSRFVDMHWTRLQASESTTPNRFGRPGEDASAFSPSRSASPILGLLSLFFPPVPLLPFPLSLFSSSQPYPSPPLSCPPLPRRPLPSLSSPLLSSTPLPHMDYSGQEAMRRRGRDPPTDLSSVIHDEAPRAVQAIVSLPHSPSHTPPCVTPLPLPSSLRLTPLPRSLIHAPVPLSLTRFLHPPSLPR